MRSVRATCAFISDHSSDADVVCVCVCVVLHPHSQRWSLLWTHCWRDTGWPCPSVESDTLNRKWRLSRSQKESIWTHSRSSQVHRSSSLLILCSPAQINTHHSFSSLKAVFYYFIDKCAQSVFQWQTDSCKQCHIGWRLTHSQQERSRHQVDRGENYSYKVQYITQCNLSKWRTAFRFFPVHVM